MNSAKSTKSTVFYNDSDKNCVAWLGNLIDAKLLPDGVVSGKAIENLKSKNLKGYTQQHYFAGIGGWPLALEQAGWGTRPVWTASLPCQPWSNAGLQKGKEDSRHAWPAFLGLVREHSPDVLFGEQVTGAIPLGWLDGVSTDLEASGYAFGAQVLGAHSAGKDHKRLRIYWAAKKLADSDNKRCQRINSLLRQKEGRAIQSKEAFEIAGGSYVGILADSEHRRSRGKEQWAQSWTQGSRIDELGDTNLSGSQGHRRHEQRGNELPARATGSFGTNEEKFQIIECSDGCYRRSQSGVFPLAHGVPGRVVKLRAYGNALCIPTAVMFIRAFMETEKQIYG